MSKRSPPVRSVKSKEQHVQFLDVQFKRAKKPASGDSPKLRKAFVKCPLCGAMISRSGLVNHKMNVHGESDFDHVSPPPHSENIWTPIVQGGATGLKK